jgi:hypothetical protein
LKNCGLSLQILHLPAEIFMTPPHLQSFEVMKEQAKATANTEKFE